MWFSCEIGQRFCNAFDVVDDTIGQLNFYLLPMEIQRILPMVIMYSQEPLVVRFFGSLCCTREQFKKVSAENEIQSSFSPKINSKYFYTF